MMQHDGSDRAESIGFLGPRGTHTEEIALDLYQGNANQFVPFQTIDGAILAVESGIVDKCVVPIENSLEGPVNITLDTLAHQVDLVIVQEIIWPVSQHLFIKPGTIQPAVIVSHSQALAQCRRYLKHTHPGVELKAVDSTAEAAALIAKQTLPYAAIASKRAGEIYGLELAAANIQDSNNNRTRFVVLSKRQLLSGLETKTSIICQMQGEKPGSLCDILQEFAKRDVNLTRIESRPARTAFGEYLFFLDLDGSIAQDQVRTAIAAVEIKSCRFKNLGSFTTIKR